MKSIERDAGFATGPSARARDQFVYTVLSRATLPQESTVLTDLVMDLFLDRYAAALRNSSPGDLLAWIEEVCAQYPDKPMPQIFAAACTVAADTFERGAPAQTADSILNINSKILSLILRPRLLPHIAPEPLSEIDVAADRIVQQLEAADRVTAEHSRAVGAWCTRLGRALGLDRTAVAHIGRSGLLHDVGKLRTPEHILSAPRELDENEWLIMKMHCVEGEAILQADRLLGDLCIAARSHHERFEGGGYPDGLAGTDIPLPARVVAVADAFNAMIARRPYRVPVTPTVAMEELLRMSGTQFDPTIVIAMREVVTIS